MTKSGSQVTSWILLVNIVQLAVGLISPSLNKRDSGTKSKPIAVTPSQNFKGNDGPWSTFVLQIGNPPQDVEVFASTASYQTIAILPGGCRSSDGPTCNADRGALFTPNSSTTWKPNTIVPNSTFTLNLDSNLGYNDNGLYGYDTVQLGWQGSGGPSLDQQIVAGIETKDFFLGMFGLNPRPTNFSTFNVQKPSYMSTLRDRGYIPSLSWGYTAGNQYRPGSVLGSLTLGGYDAGRFIPSDVSFEFNAIDENDLTVIIKNISVQGAGTSSSGGGLLSHGYPVGIHALIDSTTPYIWFPDSLCKYFEEAFGLSWDDAVQAYLINDTLHQELQAQNANVSLTLGSPNSDGSVDIVLPYGAFDLNADFPLPQSRYFPLMRATNSSQYTLGRTFLQEAYVIADYERRKFSVHQSQWPVKPEKVVAIKSPSDKLSNAAIAGAVIGAIAGLTAVGLLIFMIKKKRRIRKNVKADISELDTTDLGEHNRQPSGVQEIDGQRFLGLEIDGTKLPGHEIDGHNYHGVELGDTVRQVELDGKQDMKHEMPA
ncbi:hypothetical protein ACLMJK_005214 [Lecanora helva]